MDEKTRVLFLCIGNSFRSQMAEGLLKDLAPGRFEVESAGSFPAGLSSIAVQVMSEIGIDISKNRSKTVDEFRNRFFDYVITLCPESAEEGCPVFIGEVENILHWPFPDPIRSGLSQEKIVDEARFIRDGIKDRIEAWIRTQER